MSGPLLGVGIVILFGSVIVGVLVVFLVAAIVRWRDRVRVPCCGSCRYPVEGLSTFTCPECGADFRTAGILVKGVRPKHRMHVVEVFAAWAVVAVIGGLITSGFVGSTSFGRRMTFTRNEVLTPVSGACPQIGVTAFGTAGVDVSAQAAPAHRLLMQTAQSNAATPVALEVDLLAGVWRVRPAAGAVLASQVVGGSMPLRDSDVAGWLAASGVTIAPGGTLSEVSSLSAYVNNGGRLRDSLTFSAAAAGAGVTFGPASWVFASSAGLWTLIFVVGCVLITKAHTTRRPRESARVAAIAAGSA